MTKYRCNNVMFQTEAQKLADWKPVRCELPPGHLGNHMGRNRFATFEWWNEKENPQKEVAK